MNSIRFFVQLTKPDIMFLVLFTGATALLLEGSANPNSFSFYLALLGLYLTGGGANALNQCFERDLDAKMKRTRKRRPLPLGKISVLHAFTFSAVISVSGVLLFGFFFNWFSALLALGTILFYSLFYTLWLKPNTPQNIVIGGAAGSMAPVIAWAAAAGSLSFTPLILFLIVFFWTPPHFWALALYCKDDYINVDMPMMPVVKGDDSTLLQILIYTVILFGVSLMLFFVNFSFFYLAAAIFVGTLFVKKSFFAKKYKSRRVYFGLFKYSITHLFILYIVIIIDNLMK